MTSTVRVKASQITKDWHVIDASGRALGRVASEAATLIRGKHKPLWEPHLDVGDFVIVINASKIRLSGAKADQKVYYRHSGYPGGLKSRTFEEQLQRDPAKIIEQAVFGMLPKGPLGKAMRRHLKVYAGPQHPHESQVTGSQRAIEARKEAAAEARKEALASPPKPPRLRPFTVPQTAAVFTVAIAPAPAPEPEAPAEEVEVAAVTAGDVSAEKPARRGRKKAEAAAPAGEAPPDAPLAEQDEEAARASTATTEVEAATAATDEDDETPAESEE